MTGINYPFVIKYLEDIDYNNDFHPILQYAKEHDIPIMRQNTVSFMKMILNIKNPKRILELGSAIGYSALIMQKYSNAIITTVEKDKNMYEMADMNIKKYSIENTIRLINEDAKKALKNINQGFDFIFIDCDKSGYSEYFDLSDRLLDAEGVIICDNVLFKGEVTNDDLINRREITTVKRLREFLYNLKKDERYDSFIFPIGDGISMSVKKGRL